VLSKDTFLNFDKSHEFYSACSELSLQKYHQSPMERDLSEPWMYGKWGALGVCMCSNHVGVDLCVCCLVPSAQTRTQVSMAGQKNLKMYKVTRMAACMGSCVKHLQLYVCWERKSWLPCQTIVHGGPCKINDVGGDILETPSNWNDRTRQGR